MATYQRWRGHAKDILYNYPEHKEMIADIEDDIIYGGGKFRDGRYRRGGISNPTQSRALRLSEGRIGEVYREVQSVEALLRVFASPDCPDGEQWAKLLDMVYFKASHTLFGAARELNISESTARRGNTEALEFVAHRMGWI